MKQNQHPVSYFKLFRFATRFEIFLIFVAIACASITSLGVPFAVILYGEFTMVLVDREVRVGTSGGTNLLKFFGGGRVLTNATDQETYDETMRDAYAVAVGHLVCTLVELIFTVLSIDILNRTAQNQISRIRKLFLQAVLRQDMTWFNLNTSDNFAVRMTEYVLVFHHCTLYSKLSSFDLNNLVI